MAKPMRNDTKLARIRSAMRAGDWDGALKLASRFQRLGPQAKVIRRAANAINNQAFYEQLGHDVGKLRAEGIAALRERFSKSWEKASSSTETGGN